ncbi:MAG: RNA-binding domain-containing protein, partial [Candidatus Saccharimonadales bacterium]
MAEIYNVRRTIAQYISDGVCDIRILYSLAPAGHFLPKECELWDYKNTNAGDAVSMAKTILQIVSFYNTYGGYIIFGLDEISAAQYEPIGIQQNLFNLDQLKQLIKNYTKHSIGFTWTEIPYELNGNSQSKKLFGLITVPKRLSHTPPVSFTKNGPDTKSGRPLFTSGQIYFRRDHECLAMVDIDDLRFLAGDRVLTLSDAADQGRAVTRKFIVSHNLPDKNLICPDFSGRDEIRRELWSWLGDEVQYSRVLAGEGGKGKTSIAYKFCLEICETPPLGFEQVMWFTAKEQQWSALRNNWIQLEDAQFNDVESLLKAICGQLPINDDELVGNSIAGLKLLTKNALSQIPCLIVVDNLDSMDSDEQKRILETTTQIGNPQARFLLTTRANLAFSSDLTTKVPGFDREEYQTYVHNLCGRLKVALPNKGPIDALRKSTDGSPLLTESIFRLHKQGMPLSDALREWTGKAGADARAAAIEKEIRSLSPEARRTLLAATYFGECSFTEIKLAVGYGDTELGDCIEELSSLFLISSEKIIESEPRFQVSRNVVSVVLSQRTSLTTDHSSLSEKTKKIRQGASGIHAVGNRKLIGRAITQANALLKEGRIEDAIKTVDVELDRQTNNPDLLTMKATCFTKSDPPDLASARKYFNLAYEKGGRKLVLFEEWYSAESQAVHAPGMISVASSVIE